jgi:hypothetical protein
VAGYSGKPLVEKLGIKEGFKIAIVNSPAGYKSLLGSLPAKVRVAKASDGQLDFIQVFSREKVILKREIPALRMQIASNGMIWVTWPKGASKLETDLNENIVREIALANGLVDVKVCAVDETWSGLKLVIRLKDRT